MPARKVKYFLLVLLNSKCKSDVGSPIATLVVEAPVKDKRVRRAPELKAHHVGRGSLKLLKLKLYALTCLIKIQLEMLTNANE